MHCAVSSALTGPGHRSGSQANRGLSETRELCASPALLHSRAEPCGAFPSAPAALLLSSPQTSVSGCARCLFPESKPKHACVQIGSNPCISAHRTAHCANCQSMGTHAQCLDPTSLLQQGNTRPGAEPDSAKLAAPCPYHCRELRCYPTMDAFLAECYHRRNPCRAIIALVENGEQSNYTFRSDIQQINCILRSDIQQK